MLVVCGRIIALVDNVMCLLHIDDVRYFNDLLYWLSEEGIGHLNYLFYCVLKATPTALYATIPASISGTAEGLESRRSQNSSRNGVIAQGVPRLF